MPPQPIDPNTPLDVLIRQIAALARPKHLPLFDALVARTRAGAESLRAFQLLLAIKPNGSRLALEYVARIPEPIPPAILLFTAQVLQDRGNPIVIRVVVAGKLLGSLPDTPLAVGPVVRSVTAGLSRSRTLQRMIELQSRVETCNSLDRMVEAYERQVKLKCPKCKVKLGRAAFIRHLWDQHRLTFERGLSVDTRPLVEQAVQTAASTDDPAAVDRVFDISPHYYPTSTPVQVLQAVASRQMLAGLPVPDTLTRIAADLKAGLCPTCLNPVPDAIVPVPPALAVGPARLSGDGYAVEVTDSATGRTVSMRTPKEEWTEPPATRFDPRVFGVIVAAPVLAFGVLAVFLAPARFPPLLVALGAALLGWLVYFIIRYTRRPLPLAAGVAIDSAWQELMPKIGGRKSAARWLTRLCRASIDRGNSLDRGKQVYELVDQSAVWVDHGGVYLQLFAAARILQVCDGVPLGKEKVNELVGLFEPFFLGELPAGYAEAAAEIIQSDRLLQPADARRLSVRLMAIAFDATYSPIDLVRVLGFLPHLRVLFGTPSAEMLKLAYAVWRGRNTEPWASIGKAVTIFELAKSAPGACRKLLANHPDALLRISLPDSAERELGEVVLTPRGIVAAGKILADPDQTAELQRSPRGSGWMLAIGAHRINLDRKLDWNVVDLLMKWMRYRVEKLLPQANSADRTSPDRFRRVLTPLVRTCTLCGADSVCRTGRVGEPWPPT
jgi:predicted RNA-binding Zn-ribbon protein involved in translation (DUF1610 family)